MEWMHKFQIQHATQLSLIKQKTKKKKSLSNRSHDLNRPIWWLDLSIFFSRWGSTTFWWVLNFSGISGNFVILSLHLASFINAYPRNKKKIIWTLISPFPNKKVIVEKVLLTIITPLKIYFETNYIISRNGKMSLTGAIWLLYIKYNKISVEETR